MLIVQLQCNQEVNKFKLIGSIFHQDHPLKCLSMIYSFIRPIFRYSVEFIYYRSEQRDFAARLCGWTFDKISVDSFRSFIDELCVKKVS